jgi:hypothetical protein
LLLFNNPCKLALFHPVVFAWVHYCSVKKRGVRIRRLQDLVCERTDLASREHPGERLAEPVVVTREIEAPSI